MAEAADGEAAVTTSLSLTGELALLATAPTRHGEGTDTVDFARAKAERILVASGYRRLGEAALIFTALREFAAEVQPHNGDWSPYMGRFTHIVGEVLAIAKMDANHLPGLIERVRLKIGGGFYAY